MNNKIMLGGNLFHYATSISSTSKILYKALDYGINWIDTADIYSNGKSEEYIGKIIKKDRSKWKIATKLGQTGTDNRSGKNSKINIKLKVESSLERLNTDYIDLYQLHHFDPVTPISESIETLNQLKKEGKIINYGVANFSINQLKKTFNIKSQKIKSNQIHCNILLNNEFVNYKNFYRKTNFIAYGALGRGLLSNRFLNNKKFKSFRVKRSNNVREDLTNKLFTKLKILKKFSDNYENMSIERVSLLFLLSQKHLSNVIVGIRTLKQIKDLFHRKFPDISEAKWIDLLKELNKKGSLNKEKLGKIK